MISLAIGLYLQVGQVLSLPGTENGNLLILIQQSQQQIQQLNKILQTNELTSAQIERALALSERLNAGIDAVLKPLESSKEYQQALLRVQQQNEFERTRPVPSSDHDALADYEKYFPDEAKNHENDSKAFKEFQANSVRANAADLQDLATLDKTLKEAAPGELPKIQAQVTSKTWEANLRLSAQLTAMLKEIRSLQEELAEQKRKAKVDAIRNSEAMKKAMHFGSLDPRHD
jgi:hypothetical protein